MIKVPHIEQYAGPFCMEEAAFNAAVEHANRIDLTAHIAAMADGDGLDVEPSVIRTEDGISCISCVGTMTKYGSSLSDGPSTIALRNCIRQAAADPKCTAIMLRFDSPGGSADGTEELAADISSASGKKPVWAYVDGMAASAAYWACSQADMIVSAPASMVGSIGTYGVLYDRSAQFAQNGVKAVVIKAGEHKGVGTPGTEITPEQIADRVRVVNEINALFVAGVAKGRKMKAEDAKAMNDGRIHVGANAKAKGLVDQIGGYEDAMSGLRAAIRSRGTNGKSAPAASAGAIQKEFAMSTATESSPPVAVAAPATLKELKAKFPKSSADWREKAIEDSLTLAAAGERWVEHLSAENARLAEELVQAKQKPIGAAPIQNGGRPGEGEADPKAAIKAIVDGKIKAGIPRARAYAQACKENPELHQAWIQSHTAVHGETVRRGAIVGK